MRHINTNRIDLDDVDEWAINLVVNEAVPMNLSYPEQLVAIRLMRRKNMTPDEMAARLHITVRDVNAFTRRLLRIGEKMSS